MNDDPPPPIAQPMPSANLPALVSPVHATKVAEIQRASNDLAKLDFKSSDRILKLAGQMDLMKSSGLAAILGGVVGTAGGITFGGIAIAGFAIPAGVLTGPLGMVAGIALALLSFRGPKQWKLEKQISDDRLRLEWIDTRIKETVRQIEALPPTTSQDVKEGMWREVNVMSQTRREIMISMKIDG